jgi:hypothetical protein
MPFAARRPFFFRTDENEISPVAELEHLEFLCEGKDARVGSANRSLLLPEMQ